MKHTTCKLSMLSAWMAAGVMTLCFSFSDVSFAASESATQSAPGDSSMAFDTLPVRYIFVEGEEDKFRAHHWVNNYNAGGVEDFWVFRRVGDVTIKMEGEAIPQNNEYEGVVEIKKKGIGFIKFDYQEFRKYYDKTGGVYYPYIGYRSVGSPLRVTDNPKELALDIGHFGIETGLRMEGLPELTVGYEREFRTGSKSRLTWGTITDANPNLPGRKVAPAFADIKEIVDKFDVEAEHTIKGYEIKSEQTWEQVRIDQTRQEHYYADHGDTVRTNKYILRQHQKPESKSYNTIFKVAKWFLKEKIYTSTGYRFFTLDNKEWEDMREYDENLIPIRNGTTTENRFNSNAVNRYDSHSWVQNLTVLPYKWLSFGTKIKTEFMRRQSESTYNIESTDPPDTRINRFDVTNSKQNAQRWGENFSVRFTKIPRTALYTELELGQDRVPIMENRDSIGGQTGASATEVFDRETIADIQRGAWTIGMHTAPLSIVRVTSHLRRIEKVTDFDNVMKGPNTGGIRSAFYDAQRISVSEFLTRVSLQLTKYFQPAFRYVYRDTDYASRLENQPSVDTGHTTDSFIFDVTSQPLTDLILMASYNRTMANTFTPAATFNTLSQLPEFNADVNTFMFSTSYVPGEKVSINNAIYYSRARNFNDYTAFGLPLGADFDRVDLESGIKWNVRDHVAIEPKYALYYYHANSNAEFGDYVAHLISCEVTLGWG